MEDITIMFVWLGFFASIFLGWYFYLKARNKERMALIEKNADVSEIFKAPKFKFSFPWFKFGMIITGVGLGLITAIILSSFYKIREELVPALMLFFGGMAIIIAYFIEKSKDR